MAAFDAASGHIVVRVLYDGPAGSGKTENLRQLVQTFTAQRRGELCSPGASGPGTAYFDWLNLAGGVVAGHPLRAQLVTAPGRSELARRRWQLVRTADVIVFVCGSDTRGLAEARRSLLLLRAQLARSPRPPPIITQANKQDLEGAVGVADAARALGLPADAEIVAASAAHGTGVRDTVLRAIRAAASLAEQAIIARGVETLPAAEDETALLAQLDGSALLGATLDVERALLPPLPQEDVASGWVWPRKRGRAVLRSVARALAARSLVRVGGSGSVVLRAGDFCLRTCAARRQRDHAVARAQLLDVACTDLRLAPLRGLGRAFALAAGADDGTWLWTISPWTTTLAARIEAAHEAKDAQALASTARAYAQSAVEALALAVRDGIGLDVTPAEFGVAPDRIVYLGEPTGSAPEASFTRSMQRMRDRYATAPAIARELSRALEATIEAQRPRLDVLDASLLRALEAPP